MPRLLLLFVGLTGCSLVASLDDYKFVENGSDTDSDADCECTESALACCDGCHFVAPNDEAACAQTEAFKCTHLDCGGVIERRPGEQFCSGNSPDCDGNVVWGAWQALKECGDFAMCRMANEGEGPRCVGSMECANWIRADGASFEMGDDSPGGSEEEKPKHEVTLRSFEMMQTEVTVAMYRACQEEGACDKPGEEYGCNFTTADFENHPMNCVSWVQAGHFCEWAGARLSTEAEWEYAARSNGRDQNYPWGDNVASCEFAVIDDGGEGCGTEATFPVCSKPKGNTETGLCDMGGNVWEWVDDMWHDNYEGAPSDGTSWLDPTNEDRTIRGGSFSSSAPDTRVYSRWHAEDEGQYANIGFRCARDSNAGDVCQSSNDCHVDAVCPKLFGQEKESHCYIDCSDDPQICDGTPYPSCTDHLGFQLCLDKITLAGNFQCSVDEWAFNSGEASLVLGTGGKQHKLIDCIASKRENPTRWLIQLSGIVDPQTPGNETIDALIYWRPDEHLAGEAISGAWGIAYRSKWDASWILTEERTIGFFIENVSGQVELTAAGTGSGEIVSGTIDFEGRLYETVNEI